MYDNFTKLAKKVMQCANKEAQRFDHNCLLTEHVLLGIIKTEGATALTILQQFIDSRKIRLEVEKRLITGAAPQPTVGKLHLTRSVTWALEFAENFARIHNRQNVTTIDILLGLLCAPTSLAATTLTQLNIQFDNIYKYYTALKDADIDVPLPCSNSHQVILDAVKTIESYLEQIKQNCTMLEVQ